jgi:hypothetical protein
VTIASETNRTATVGDGVTTLFNFNAPYRASTDFEVILRTNATGAEEVLVLNTHYTIAGVANANTGGFDSMQLTMLAAPPATKTLVINRKVAPTSSFDPAPNAALTAPNQEGIIDRLCLAVQSLQEQLNRAILLPKTSPLANKFLPDPAVNLGAYLKYNAAGDGVEATTNVNLSGTAVSGFAATLLDDANAGAFLTTLGITAFIQTLLDDPDASTALSTLGVSAFVKTLLDDATAKAFLTTLGVKSATSAAADFASVADNATSAALNVNVPGAAVGDWAFATSNGSIMTTAGAFLLAKVTAPDTVSVFLHNDSAGAFDPVAQDVYVMVMPKALFI